MHGSKTEIKVQDKLFFRVTMVYLKENSTIKDKFFKKILTQIRKTYFLPPKWGINLYYTGLTYTQVNMVTSLLLLPLHVNSYNTKQNYKVF